MAKALGLTLPVGIGQNGYFRVTTSVLEQVTSNLQNLLLTKIGERPMQPTFGSELHRFVFEAQTDDGLADVRGTIEDSVKTWMPFVTIDDVLIDRQTDFNRIIVRIYFSVTTMVGLTGNVSLVF